MNKPERILVIGDIHGCLGKLLELMERVAPRPGKDQLIFIGDYIDRGEDSPGVIDYLLQVREEFPGSVFLLGNHEKMFLDFLDGVEQALYLHNGGYTTLRNYLNHAAIESLDIMSFRRVLPATHRAFLNNLVSYYETESHLIVHAGLRPGVALSEQSLEDLVWIREEFLYSEEDFGKTVVFGHTPFVRPLVLPNKIGIDTGAVYGNLLTCLVLPEETFVSV